MSNSTAPSLLVKLLGSPRVEIQRESLKLLSELVQEGNSCQTSVYNPEHVKETVILGNGIGIILKLLESADEETQESALFAVSYLSDRSCPLQFEVLITASRGIPANAY